MVDAARFIFLNREGECATAGGWNDPKRDKLWLYNLHYFDDLSATGAGSRATWHSELISRWIAENPPRSGIGWESYPTSLRIVNWVKWILAGNVLPASGDRSLALQARWLARRVEHHLQANHLFANAKALVFAGCYFDGIEAVAWLDQSLTILAQELSTQILTDGGHIELSPMYHALILEDLFDLINLARAAPGVIPERVVNDWRRTADHMYGWLRAMSHPDGEIAFFNDAAFGVAPAPDALGAYAHRLGSEVSAAPTSLSTSGYVRVERDGAVLLADLAAIGADYQPAHAHADTLSFELSVHGYRVFVNSGTSTYHAGSRRHFERSTAAHSTVEVAGLDSSEVWSGFRVARRARMLDATIRENDSGISVGGSHDGYRRLRGRPVHHREWFLGTGLLRVTDRLSSGFDRAVARFYLHPAVDPGERDSLLLPNGVTCRYSATGGRPSVASSQWRPRFGVSVPSRCLEFSMQGPELIVEFRWL